MKIKDAIAAIRAAGMSGRYSPDMGEWRVTFPKFDMPDAERREAVASYCYDPQDAIATAKAMREHFERNNPPVWEQLAHIGG